ncbi:unnamed protein product [Didymodactylos carnosus]|uniref:Uncharacterized protein n=1 Tax=Didymodactylos carnosus TaxID=1234261 RepID=A0A815LCC6_9BILA|nr:unnamed protein product [Didymodactylos carnosus]CAF4298178.1 unnamed protein product [Didymodactylos carnosus]
MNKLFVATVVLMAYFGLTECVSVSVEDWTPVDDRVQRFLLESALTRALSVQSEVPLRDSYGCDVSGFVVSDCGQKGKCCDVHDDCYRRNGCSAASWLWPVGACGACNAAVVGCITTSNPGPSSCCKNKNCGKPRP